MMAYLPKAAGHLMVGSSLTKAETGLETNNRADARLPLLGVGIPLKPGVVLGLTAFPLAAVRYDLSQQIEGDPDYLLRTKGSGTWTDIAATFAARGGNGALGLQVGIPVSGFGETVTREFDTEGYTTRTEEWQTELRDALFAVAGAQYQLWILGLGGFVQMPTEGTVENVQELPDGSESKSSYTVGFPAVYGGGASLKLTKSFTLAGEYRRFPWSEIEIDGENWRESANELDFINGFKDIDAYGAGIEWVNGVGSVSRSVWDHLSYRIGYSFQPWLSAGPNLGRVTDESATIGLGIPFERGNGAIDIALRYTRRLESESDLREDVIAFLFGISFGGQPRDY